MNKHSAAHDVGGHMLMKRGLQCLACSRLPVHRAAAFNRHGDFNRFGVLGVPFRYELDVQMSFHRTRGCTYNCLIHRTGDRRAGSGILLRRN